MATERRTIAIENAGESVMISSSDRDVLSVYIRGDDEAEYAIDVNDDPDNSWFEEAETLSGQDINYGGFEGADFIRLRCTTGTGGAGDDAEVLVSTSGR